MRIASDFRLSARVVALTGLLITASLTFAQTSGRRSVWAVAELRDLRSCDGRYGKAASSALGDSLSAAGITVVASVDPPTTTPRRSRVPAMDVEAIRARVLSEGAFPGTLLSGEFVDKRIVRLKGGRRAEIALRLVMVDAASGLIVGGDWERGESEGLGKGATDETLIAQAIRQAASIAVRALPTTCPPAATVLTMCFGYQPLTNRGADQGFRTGDRLVVIRNGSAVGQGSVGASELDQSEIVPDPDCGRIGPGDLVRLVVPPPVAVPVGRSVFDSGCAGLTGPHRRGR